MGCISSTKSKTSQGKLEEPIIGVFTHSKKEVVARGYPISPKGSALLVPEAEALLVPEADPLRDEVTNAALTLYDAIESLSEQQVKYNLSQNEELLMDFDISYNDTPSLNSFSLPSGNLTNGICCSDREEHYVY